MKIGVVNYSLGNVGSVCSAFRFYHYDVHLVDNGGQLAAVDAIVLAGVGNFATAAGRLKEHDLWESLNEQVLVRKKPVLGICLGMQLFADTSFEDGCTPGFGWIRGQVRKIEGDAIRIPHMGWDQVSGDNHSLFAGVKAGFFYFMHSYHFIPDDLSVVVARTPCGEADIVSAVHHDNVVGVQFHPEKSQGDGLRVLRNFVEMATS